MSIHRPTIHPGGDAQQDNNTRQLVDAINRGIMGARGPEPKIPRVIFPRMYACCSVYCASLPKLLNGGLMGCTPNGPMRPDSLCLCIFLRPLRLYDCRRQHRDDLRALTPTIIIMFCPQEPRIGLRLQLSMGMWAVDCGPWTVDMIIFMLRLSRHLTLRRWEGLRGWRLGLLVF
jgi:hypothetical protein